MFPNTLSDSPREVAETTEQYGNTMLDATYKMMKYELALCVRTNVGYSVVAEFIVQEESAEKIAEALGVIKQWNPSWNPSFYQRLSY